MMIINLLLLQLIIVYIVDLSGVINSIKWLAWRILFGKVGIEMSSNLELKPFTCSKCLMFWFGICLLFFIPGLTITTFILYLAYVSMLSYLTTTSMSLLILFKDMLDVLIIKISDKINR
jgi:hypothetical protein